MEHKSSQNSENNEKYYGRQNEEVKDNGQSGDNLGNNPNPEHLFCKRNFSLSHLIYEALVVVNIANTSENVKKTN